MRTSVLATVLLGLSVLVLADRILGGPVLDVAAALAFIVLCLVGLPSGTIREVLLSVASVALGLLAWRGEEGLAAVVEALDLAAFFAAFILLLTALKIAAERSRAVLEVGRYLTAQPASRRFLTTATGGHLLGVFLNFGAISLMAPLIQTSARGPDGQTDTRLERRQLTALLRGFSWILLWAPTTLAQAVLLTLFTDIDLGRIIALGIATSVLLVVVGFALDRIEWRGEPVPGTVPPPFPRRALARLGTICGILIAGTAGLQLGAGFSTALSLMVVAPVVTAIWFATQGGPGHIRALWPALKGDATGLARSAIALGLSGFIGRVAADVLPMERLTDAIDITVVPGWLFLAILPVLITLGGQVALSPIILVVFIGQVVQMLPALPAEPTNIVFALGAGWAISMLASPNATATLLISATTRIAPTRLTWHWNLRYAALCYVIFVAIFAVLEA